MTVSKESIGEVIDRWLGRLLPLLVLVFITCSVAFGTVYLRNPKRPQMDSGSTIDIKPSPPPPHDEFLADEIFEFASSQLNSGGRARIRAYADALPQRQLKQILVIGHSDAIGTQRAKLRISQDRARSVLEFLKMNADLRNVETRALGVSDMDPVISFDSCSKTDGDQISACLSPNRRVQIWTR